MKTVIFRGSIPLRFAAFPNIPGQKCGVRTSIDQFLARSEGAHYGRAPPCPAAGNSVKGKPLVKKGPRGATQRAGKESTFVECMSTTPIRTPLVCPRQARGPSSGNLVNLSGYKVTTYQVSIVAEPKNKSGFEKHRGTQMMCGKDAYNFARKIFKTLGLDQDREHFILLALNNKNFLSGLKGISSGSMTASLVHAREVFHAAIVLRAVGVIFVHNHPSGDPAPSPEDKDITKRLTTVADVMGIRVLDHVIMGDGRYFSFNERNML